MRLYAPAVALLALAALGSIAVPLTPIVIAAPAALPPPEETARQALERSPRHGEWVDVEYAGHAPLRTWVVYPERADKAGVVLVIHEIYGLSDWIRALADQLAAEGFIAVAPDLVSGLGPAGGGTDSTASRDDIVKLVRWLSPGETVARLSAVRAWAATIPSANGKLATIGFCWGGGRSFAAAASDPPIQGSVVYYGATPDSAQLTSVRAPVLAHYGGDDERVNATIARARDVLKRHGVWYETHLYPGAGHGFMRQQTQRDGANQRAAGQSWPRTRAFLRGRLR